MKIAAIIQARTGSTRLPGKVLIPIGGKPALQWVTERIMKSDLIDHFLLATTILVSDDSIERFCGEYGIRCFRGSELDVLDRYYMAACSLGMGGSDIVVRITGDCQLIEPKICDSVISALMQSDADYVSNVVSRTFPKGLDCEAMRFFALEKSWRDAKLEYEREHVTQYILKNPELFKIENYAYHTDLSQMRWTLDTPEDLEFIKAVIEGLATDNFDMNDVLSFLDKHPELLEINSFT